MALQPLKGATLHVAAREQKLRCTERNAYNLKLRIYFKKVRQFSETGDWHPIDCPLLFDSVPESVVKNAALDIICLP